MNAPHQDEFVPLSAGAPAPRDRTDLRVTVLRDPQDSQAFQPLHQPAPAASTGVASSQSHAHEPQVSVQRDGDRVSGIHIQCTCGRVIELGCVYQSSPGKS